MKNTPEMDAMFPEVGAINRLTNILIVDDEPDIRKIIRIPLEVKGYTVAEAENGETAVRYIAENPNTDLILLDILMPGISGYDACMQIRKFSTSPILFLTAKTQESDKLEAYASGGDDFLEKPFSQAELLMKVSSLIRRYRVYKGKSQDSVTLLSGGVVLDIEHNRIYKNGEQVELTDTEFQIFRFLVSNRGKTVTPKDLFEGVWHEKYLSTSSNTVMVHILNLRKKLEEDTGNPKLIRTIWGKGYQVD